MKCYPTKLIISDNLLLKTKRQIYFHLREGFYVIANSCFRAEGGTCLLGESSCTKAHSLEELAEWKERHQYRMTKIKTAKDQKLYAYMDELLSMHKAGMDVVG